MAVKKMQLRLNLRLHVLLQFILFVLMNAVAEGLISGDAAKWVIIIISGLQMTFGIAAHNLDRSGVALKKKAEAQPNASDGVGRSV